MQLFRMKRIVFVSSAALLISLLVSIVPAHATSNRTRLANSFSALQSDYNQIVSGVQTGNETKAEAGFVKFSRDCIPLATFETSFSKTINEDIFAVAQIGNGWAWVGYITLTTNSDASAFQTQTARLTKAMNKFAKDLKNGL